MPLPAPSFLACHRAAALTLLTSVLACVSSPYPPPPETRRAVVVDTLHGVTIEDPYRWLEDQESQEVQAWIEAQNRYADSILGPDSVRREFAERLRALMDAPSITPTRRAGAWEYFALRRPGDEVAAIYRRPSAATPTPVDPRGAYEKVIDPLTMRGDGTLSVNLEGISPDNRLLLYSVRDGGADEVEVRVLNVDTRQDLPDRLPWALYASLSFSPDGKGLYYVHRSRSVGPRLKYHRLGADPATDSVVFGDGYGPTAFLNVSHVDGGKRRIVTVGHGWARNDVFVQDLVQGGPAVPVARDLAAHFAPQFVDGKLWMRTDLNAPRGRVVAVDLSDPAPERWVDMIPQGDDVLESFTIIGDRVYVTYLRNASQQIRVFSMAGALVDSIAVPPLSSASIRAGRPGRALLTVSGFAQPSVTYDVELATGNRSVWERSEVPFDSTGIVVRQVWYTSKDGTRAPMFVMHKRDVRPTGALPVLLTGYGGFNVALTPRFDPRAAVWVERGGVFAQATLRGGLEFGEEWHRGGMLGNKQNVFDDFLAAAQWFIDSGYTSPRHVAIRGSSNGGLLMGSAITQRPDLFRVAYIGNPDLDMVRFWTFNTANNAPALLEYGDASKPDEFAFISKYSPFQNVRDGARYPAVLFMLGHLDTRVPPLQARKFAARLQRASRSGLPVIMHYDPRQGHAGGLGNSHRIQDAAKELQFLWRMVQGR